MTQQVLTTGRDILANLQYQLYDETFGGGATALDPVSLRYRHAPLDAVFIFRQLRLLCGDRCVTEDELRDSEFAIGPGDLHEMQSKLFMKHPDLELSDMVEGVSRILTEARHKRAEQLAALREKESEHSTIFGSHGPSQTLLATG